eukprot:1925069-Alexandrium_andersonii.AAC.1
MHAQCLHTAWAPLPRGLQACRSRRAAPVCRNSHSMTTGHWGGCGPCPALAVPRATPGDKGVP